MLDLHRLRLLRELKHRGTLAAVARALSYSPSAVSQQLAVLEAEAGTALIEPVGRKVRLTPAAERLVEHAEALLERMEQAEADLATSLTAVSGTLRVATFQTAALALLPAALTEVAARHPQLRVQVTELEPEQALPALLARDFDLVVTEEYPGRPLARSDQLEVRHLTRDRLRLATPADRPAEHLADLRDRAWVMEPAWTPARPWAVAACRTAGFEPDVRFESTDLLLHARLVRTGHAVALLPDLVWAGTGTDGVHLAELHSDPPAELPAERTVSTATRRGAETRPDVVAFRAGLATAVAGLGTVAAAS